MDINIVIDQMIQLFLILGLGYLLRKVHLFDQELNKKLTSILLCVTTPAMVLASVLNMEGNAGYGQVADIFLLGLGVFTIMPLLGLLIAILLRAPKFQKGLYIYMTTFSNVGFMGFPVLKAIFGSEAVFYGGIFNMIFNTCNYSLGIWMMHIGQPEAYRFEPKKLLHPGILSSLAALLIYLLRIKLPHIIGATCEMVGDVTPPLAMLVIGSTLAAMPLKEVFSDIRIYPYTLIKQLLLPVVLFPLLKLFISDPLVLGVSLVIISMPVANSSVLFSTEYGGDEKLAAKGVFLTTLVSVATIPLMVYWFLI